MPSARRLQDCSKPAWIISMFAFLLIKQSQATGAAGKQFILGFMENVENDYETTLVIGGNRHTSSDVTVTCPGLKFLRSFQVPGQDTVAVRLPREAVNVGSVHDTKGVLVESSAYVTVYGLSTTGANALDGFAALPTRALGTDYLVISTGVSDRLAPEHRWSEFLLVGSVDDTTVELHLAAPTSYRNASYSAGETLRIVISSLETVQLQSQRDLTGTRVISDRPVAVLSGSKCANIPTDVAACDHLVEYLPPVNLWGKGYLLSTFIGRVAGDYFRVIALEAGTRATIVAPSIGRNIVHLEAGEFHSFELNSLESGYVISVQPIMVAQYSQGASAEGGTNGDPSMLLVTPLGQWSGGTAAHVTFSASNATAGGARPLQSYLTVTSPCTASGDVTVDGQPLAVPTELVRMPGTHGNEEYFCTMRSPLAAGTHTLSATEDSARFAAYVYGFGKHVAYSYPLAWEEPLESFSAPPPAASVTTANRGRSDMVCLPRHQYLAAWVATGAFVGTLSCALVCYVVLRRKFRAVTAVQPCNNTTDTSP